MQEIGLKSEEWGLESSGIKNAKTVYWNQSPAQLVEHALAKGEGSLADNGAICCDTGKFTGRSPKDRFIVEDAKTTLQEYLQARNMAPARYVVTNETGPEHRKVFHVELSIGDKTMAVASGMTKKSAETQAAQIALTTLKSEKKSSQQTVNGRHS